MSPNTSARSVAKVREVQGVGADVEGWYYRNQAMYNLLLTALLHCGQVCAGIPPQHLLSKGHVSKNVHTFVCLQLQELLQRLFLHILFALQRNKLHAFNLNKVNTALSLITISRSLPITL